MNRDKTNYSSPKITELEMLPEQAVLSGSVPDVDSYPSWGEEELLG